MEQFTKLMARLDEIDLDVEEIDMGYPTEEERETYTLYFAHGAIAHYPFIDPVSLLEFAVLMNLPDDFDRLFTKYIERGDIEFGKGCNIPRLIMYATERRSVAILRQLDRYVGHTAASLLVDLRTILYTDSYYPMIDIKTGPLLNAVIFGDIAVVEALVAEGDINMDILREAMVYAISEHSDPDVLKVLLTRVEDSSYFDLKFVRSVAYLPFHKCHIDELLAHGINFAAVDEYGRNVVHWMVTRNDHYLPALQRLVECCPWLLERTDSRGRTPAQLLEHLSRLTLQGHDGPAREALRLLQEAAAR